MVLEKIGYRRLYDAFCCELEGKEEYESTFKINGFNISLYIGPHPRGGTYFIVRENDHLCIKPNEQVAWHFKCGKSPKEVGYSRSFFTEIVCWKEFPVDDELSYFFHIGDDVDAALGSKRDAAKFKLLDIVHEQEKEFIDCLEIVSGLLALRVHPQLIQKKINENSCINHEGHWSLGSFSSEAIETFYEFHIQQQAVDGFKDYFSDEIKDYKFKMLVLSWLIRAWQLNDNVSRFFAFFTVLELIVKKCGNPRTNQEQNGHLEKIEELIQTHCDGAECKQLFPTLKKCKEKLSPSLVDYFISLAEEYRLRDWESDIIVFKKFYRHRNDLIHRGKQDISTHIRISKEEVHSLKDLVEKYCTYYLFVSKDLYPDPGRRNYSQ